eukprot:11608545-Alexandrium_andersonii.AAC.1
MNSSAVSSRSGAHPEVLDFVVVGQVLRAQQGPRAAFLPAVEVVAHARPTLRQLDGGEALLVGDEGQRLGALRGPPGLQVPH